MREYSTREVAEVAGLPPQQVRRWARARLVTPEKDSHGRWRYSFQDLALLRTAAKLLESSLSLGRVTRTLRLLKNQLPEGRPLSAVRILVAGQRVVVRDRLASWDPESLQGTLDFDVRALSEQAARKITFGSRSEREPAPANDNAAEWYEAAVELELAGRGEEAQRAYDAALQRDPTLVRALINLGRLVHSAGRLQEAEALYREALDREPDNALAAFNLGVALEDQRRFDAAIQTYRQTIAIDAAYADAHFNLARLLEERGDKHGALRHLSRFKRLMKKGG